MAQQIGQLSYVLFNPTADPGEPFDMSLNQIDSFPNSDTVSLNPGIFCEMASDGLGVQGPQQTGATFAPVGVILVKRAREGSGAVGVTGYGVGGAAYNPGEYLPVISRGRVYAAWDSTSTQQGFTKPNVMHSSTVATSRGVVTFQATSTTAGSEIAAAPSCVKTRQVLPSTGSIIVVDVNLPGA